MAKQKILHLITGLEIGGAEKALASMLPRLPEYDHLVCSLRSKGPIAEILEQQGFKTAALESGKIFSLGAVFKFLRLLKKEKPDMVLTYLIQADFFGRIFSRLFGIRKICCFLRSELSGQKYAKVFLLEKLTSFLVTRYFAVSAEVKNVYVKKAKIPADKISVIPNGINLAKNPPQDPAISKQFFKLPENKKVIACVAKLRPEKNHLLLLQCFQNTVQAHPESILVLAGDGPEKYRIQSWIAANQLQDKVFLLGNVSTVSELLSVSDIFILLSSYEGMSNAILEAMAAGCPIIASDIPANRELVEQQKNGLLVPLKNSGEISRSLSLLLADENLREKMKLENLHKIQNYSIERTAVLFKNELKRILGHSK